MSPEHFWDLADCQKGENKEETWHDTAHYSGFYCAEMGCFFRACVAKKNLRIYEHQEWADTVKSVINCGLLRGKEYKGDLPDLIA